VGGDQVAWLNAERGRMVGPGRTQEIYAGDSLKLQVYGKYLEDKNQKVNAGSFATQGAKDKLINDLNELAVSTQRAGGANPIALFNLAYILTGDLQKKSAPEAYLIYALYDQDSNRYEVGKKVLSKNAANQHEVLEENMYISKDGYMETFVVNETSEDVWFDNMMVMSISSVIVQETHYDPWGLELTGLGFQYGGIKANKYLYQGKELMDDHNLNLYDFHARGYDPVIGRTLQIDPGSESYYPMSPYSWVMNNPLKFVDPTGMFADFYDKDDNYLGNDGVDDDKVYRSTSYNIDFQTGENGKTDWEGVRRNSTYLGQVSDVFVTGDDATDKRIQNLHPAIRMKATSFVNEANEGSGNTLIRIAQGFRTVSEQDGLYAQGRTQPGSIVTNAKGGYSNHNFGLAFDIVGITDGKIDYNLDWKSLSNLGKSKGFEWGGDWKFQDKPHFQMQFGNSLKDLRALPKNNKGYPILKF
jgi:RHS repeat-associated protein